MTIEELRAKLTYVTFQIAFSCFSSDSPQCLHVALNSFRKRYSNAFSRPLFCASFAIKTYDYGRDLRFKLHLIVKYSFPSHLDTTALCSFIIMRLIEFIGLIHW